MSFVINIKEQKLNNIYKYSAKHISYYENLYKKKNTTFGFQFLNLYSFLLFKITEINFPIFLKFVQINLLV